MISRGHQSDVAVITRSLAQKPAYKDLKHTGQSPANALEATYTPVSNRASSRSVIMRSPAQQPACKDPERNGHNPTIAFKAAYTPVSTALAHAQS
ncbi:IMP cyclohydrolase [Lacticaseibacillus paracasei]|nr:IMP cyclohydrolase [Lacticaseibacillus paracasei]MCT3378997.1 IMP cyclohydrolase [Lacticaseibacillus paracasei]QDR76564.1 IMP cyclohydrolase [Lacticaseibacillus paracasei]QEM98562.1 IMP cyclohydrolase [Lacticaseibacillus paracasei]QKK94392.1 IMP cyclohydrolase [Lacticaseibacillus paracasei]